MLNCKSILITGGTGSFGKQFVKTVLDRYGDKLERVIIFSRDEQKQYDMQHELAEHKNLRFFVGDVRDVTRLEMAMREVDCVIHAAAMKHVPTAEYNPLECIKTNVHGAENIVLAAIRSKVKKVIALSTDKAVNPINLYGATKLAADKIFISSNNLSGKGEDGKKIPIFSVVRYGNVFGSRGSVIPLYQQLLQQGARELPITDERMTRFWITLPQGVEFVLKSLEMMRGGEIFVPKIPSMRVVDIAATLAPGCRLKKVGIRPGEKLHEVLVTEDDARTTVEYEDRFIVEPAFAFWKGESEKYYRDKGAVPVPEEFRYRSDTNSDWVSKEQLIELLREVGIVQN